jgi:hypothetical protein
MLIIKEMIQIIYIQHQLKTVAILAQILKDVLVSHLLGMILYKIFSQNSNLNINQLNFFIAHLMFVG